MFLVAKGMRVDLSQKYDNRHSWRYNTYVAHQGLFLLA
ncbi:hypothetical protein OF001_U220024 [Pseudomonas sp. OF001]|nr:hypothetical protein OF001_U220024 [Pseudomonas sp. OF001]